MDQVIQFITVAAIPILFAITLHEAAHGYAARHFGDMTAEREGRISLNPLRHIDPIGTVALPLILLLMHQPMFGWAKPVPVNFAALRRPKKDMLWVALAGPATNLVMALGWGLVGKLAALATGTYYSYALWQMAKYGIQINVILVVLNMIPMPPLDGGRVAVSLLPARPAIALAKFERYGMFLLIFLAVTQLLWLLLLPPVIVLADLISFLFGLPSVF